MLQEHTLQKHTLQEHNFTIAYLTGAHSLKCAPVRWFFKKYLCFISQFLRTLISLDYLNLFEFMSILISLVYECARAKLCSVRCPLVTNLASVNYTPIEFNGSSCKNVLL